MNTAALPYVDEHSTDVAVDAADVWPELLEGLERSFSHRAAEIYARVIGSEDTAAGGPRPPARLAVSRAGLLGQLAVGRARRPRP